jgi:imidazolonepropionase-like amidohydrolase
VLEEADEAYVLAAQLAKRDIPVLMRPSYLTRTMYSRDGSEERFTAFSALLAAGVKTALLPVGAAESEGLLATAAFAMKYGATREQALRAITLTPAEFLGVADRVGSIAEGRDADLLMLTGDPLDVTTRIERVLVNGKVVVGKKLSEY